MAGRSRKEAMELSLPRSVWSKGSSLDLVWFRSAPGAHSPVDARGEGVLLGGTACLLVLVTGFVALQRVRRRRTVAVC